jgi:hypothetical protein
MSFLVLFATLLVFLGYALIRARLKASRLSRMSWEDLVARLEPVRSAGIARVARDYLEPSKRQIDLEPFHIWEMVGEEEGLRRMRANAEILIALAGYAQRWNFDESVVVAERMRRDGVALRRAVFELSLGVALGDTRTRGPFSVQEAAGAYYLMRQRLLALYETSHAGRYEQLAAAM